MKNKVIYLMLVFCFLGGYAQTGIGIDLPNGTTELEVFSTAKGVLIPRVELDGVEDTTTITGDEYPESLLVYHTGTPTLLSGYYFWKGDKWNALVSTSTLYTYIKETAKDGNVTINVTEDNRFIVTWTDKVTGITEELNLGDFISGNNVFGQDTETLIGKFGDKDVMRYTTTLTKTSAFTALTLPLKIEGMLLNTTLINEVTSAIVRGVIGKNVVGEETTLMLGTAGSIITSNPQGTYSVIVEYVKP